MCLSKNIITMQITSTLRVKKELKMPCMEAPRFLYPLLRKGSKQLLEYLGMKPSGLKFEKS